MEDGWSQGLKVLQEIHACSSETGFQIVLPASMGVQVSL